MPLQDRIAHATAVAKWKADQQLRLLKSQNRISDVEGQIKAQKADLAEKTLALYAQEQLMEDELKRICADIAVLYEQIKEQQSLQEAIRRERSPEQQVSQPTYPPVPNSESQAGSPSGLVCPQCGRSLVGRFCPDHGVEGVEPPQKSEPIETDISTTQLICPECKRPLSVRFCPDHGLEGIPQPPSEGE
jgi:hypothetical protein